MTLEVRLDDRMRLAGSLLAAGDWFERENTAKPYKPHRVAEYATRHFALHRSHPAVEGVQVLSGTPVGLKRLFQQAWTNKWAGSLIEWVSDFYDTARPDRYWADTAADWEQAETDAREVFKRVDMVSFLNDLFGDDGRKHMFAPNLLFPGLQTMAASSPKDIVIVAPPPKAWGASPPWRYSERPDEVLATVSEAFARFLFEEKLPFDYYYLKPRAEIFALSAAVLFMRRAEGDDAANQFMVMEKRTRGFAKLTSVVATLDTILESRRNGEFANFIEYVPYIADTLMKSME
jgi:hypothetical protein